MFIGGRIWGSTTVGIPRCGSVVKGSVIVLVLCFIPIFDGHALPFVSKSSEAAANTGAWDALTVALESAK